MAYLKKYRHKNTDKIPRIIVDSREKQPWVLKNYIMCKKALQTGDYTFEGFENIFAIERKRSFGEFIYNISGVDRERFRRELNRLKKIIHSFIVIEDSIDSIKQHLDKLPLRVKIDEYSVYYWLMYIQVVYGIPVIITGANKHNQQTMIYLLFDQVLKEIGYG